MKIEVLPTTNNEMDKYLKSKHISKMIPMTKMDKPSNGIPTLVNSNGINTPSISESLSSKEISLLSNYNYIRSVANDLFDNLKVEVEIDQPSKVLNILVEGKYDDVSNMTNIPSPYPISIVIQDGYDPIVTYNSKKSGLLPDYSTRVVENNSPFDMDNWIDDPSGNTLEAILISELSELDDRLYSNKEVEVTEELNEVEYPYRIKYYSPFLIIDHNFEGDKFSKWNKFPITKEEANKFFNMTSHEISDDKLPFRIDKRSIPTQWKSKVLPLFNEIARKFGYDK